MKKLFTLFFLLIAVSGWCVGSSSLDLGATRIAYPFFVARLDTAVSMGVVASFSFPVTLRNSGMYDGIASATTPIAGLYKGCLTSSFYDSDEAAVFHVYIMKNGVKQTNQLRFIKAGTINSQMSVSAIFYLDLAAGDVISLQQTQTTGTGGTIAGADQVVEFSLEFVPR